MASRSDSDPLGNLISSLAELINRYRLELALTALLALTYYAARPYGALTVATLVIVTVALPWTRRYMHRALHGQHVKRRFADSLEKVERGRQHPAHARVTKVRAVPVGDHLRLKVGNGTSVDDLAARQKQLAAAMSTRTSPVRKMRISHDHEGGAEQATALLIRRDPFNAPPLDWPWKAKEQVSLWEPVPVGINELGETVSVNIVGKNFLIGGEPESGKSIAQAIWVAAAVKDPDCHLWIMDGKQLDTAVWAPAARRIVGPNGRDAIAMLHELHEEMEARRRELLALGAEKINRDMGLPFHFVLVDELAAYLRLPDKNDVSEILRLLLDLVSQGRAAGIIVCAATQRPGSDLHDQFTAVRDLFSFRLAFRCKSWEMSDMILGTGSSKAGYNAAEILARQRGVGILHADGYTPERIRGFFLTREDRHAMATQAVTAAMPDASELSSPSPRTPHPTPKRVSAEEARARGNRASLLAALPGHGDGLTRSEIQAAVGRPDRELWPVLKAVLASGEVKRSGGGKKGDPYRYRRATQAGKGGLRIIAEDAPDSPGSALEGET